MGQPIEGFGGVGMQTLTFPSKRGPAVTARSGLRIEVVRSLEALQPYETAWNRLAFESPQRWPWLSYAWIVSYLEALLEPGESWCCLLATEDDELVGVLPVIIEPYSCLGLNRPRLGTPHKWDTLSVDFLAANGRYEGVVPLMLAALRREYPRLFHLMLRGLQDLSPTLSLARGGLNPFVAYQEFSGLGAYLPIRQSFREYYATLDRHFRKTVSRANERLEDLGDVSTIFLQGQDAARWECRRFLDLEASGWKGKKGSAMKSKPAVARFYESLIRRLGQLGWLRWYLLISGSRLLAGQLAIQMNGKLIAAKIAYDEALAHCAPGKLLFERVVQHTFASGEIDEIDCLSDAHWLEDWGVEKRPYYDLWLYPRRVLSLTRGLLSKRAVAELRRLPEWLPLRHWLPAQLRVNG